jgi:hypothetical protein
MIPRMDATATRDRSRRAVRAAVVVAAEHGLPIRDATVLKDGSNLTVELLPARVVARVATNTGLVRDAEEFLTRELDVAGFLTATGAPVVSPSGKIDPGPHERDGLVLTFWERAPVVPEPADPAAAAAALRRCHEALPAYGGELRELGMLTEARELLERLADEEVFRPPDAAFLAVAGELFAERIGALGLALRPIHGDAHLRNVLNTEDGPLWADWEDAFLGPLEWDLACLIARGRVLGTGRDRGSEALAAYGTEFDEGVLELMVEARTFQAVVWGAVLRRDRGGTTYARLRWLRARLAGQIPRS